MTKEQYLSIVASWKNYIHGGNHKKYKKIYNLYDRDYNNYGNKIGEAYYWKSDLTSLHHLIYSLIRNKDLLKGFKDNEILDNLKKTLKLIINNTGKEGSYAHDIAKKLLTPFGECFTLELLKEVVNSKL